MTRRKLDQYLQEHRTQNALTAGIWSVSAMVAIIVYLWVFT